MQRVAKNIDALENVTAAHYSRSFTEITPPDSRTLPVVQNDAGGYDLDRIAEPFFRRDNPAGSSGGSFIMHGHL